jgi:hypothetical protein
MSTTHHDELWRVQLASGEMRIMTLDALDEAFQAGTIDASTKVLAPGADTWSALGDVAGLDGDAAEAPASEGVPSLSPMAADIPSSHGSRVSTEPVDLSAYDPSFRVPADFEIDENALKTSKGRVGALIGAGVLAVVGLLFLGAKVAGNLEGAAASNAMRPSAAGAPAAAVDVMDIDARAKQLSEDQRKRLLEADKARESTRKARPTTGGAAPGAARPAREKGAPFVNGGDKFDPLNGAL